LYSNIFNSLTVDQQQALLRGRVHLPPDPSHNLRATAAGPGRGIQTPGGEVIEARAHARVIPMRPLDIGKEWHLDYTSPTTIKLYNKAIEAVKGEAFDGKYLYSWLARVHDKARAYSWLSILTINGRILTKSYADISMDEVRQHAQRYQNEARRGAQNAEQMLTCLQASISRTVYNRVQQLTQKFTIIREPEKEEIWDGVCYLKVIIDSYHVNTRSSTAQIRKRLAQLPMYMKQVAKGDVQNLCIHTRNLLDQLQAAGETTMDLLTNLMEALKLAPNGDFQRWLKTRIDMWSTKQIDWKPDGSDLMEEAEQYYMELKTTRNWGHSGKTNEIYALQATEEYEEISNTNHTIDQVDKENGTATAMQILALATQFKKQQKHKWEKPNNDNKYKWKLKGPKDGEPNTKRVFQDGEKKTYHWCPHHKMWTIHKPEECKNFPIRSKGKAYRDQRRAYVEAKAALMAMALSSDEEENSNTEDKEDGSVASAATEYINDDDSNTS
jgi:hypothetical protein